MWIKWFINIKGGQYNDLSFNNPVYNDQEFNLYGGGHAFLRDRNWIIHYILIVKHTKQEKYKPCGSSDPLPSSKFQWIGFATGFAYYEYTSYLLVNHHNLCKSED